jgi:hypothetical protein
MSFANSFEGDQMNDNLFDTPGQRDSNRDNLSGHKEEYNSKLKESKDMKIQEKLNNNLNE